MNVGPLGALIDAVKQNCVKSESVQIALTYIVSTPACHLCEARVSALQTPEMSMAKTKKVDKLNY